MAWDKVISSKQIDSPCEVFLNIFTSFYEKIIEKFVVKSKTLKNLWTTKDILKSPKTKQKLYDKFSNSKIYEHDISCKNYGQLFELIKQRANSQYYSKMTQHYKDNMKRTWQIMKEVLAKANLSITHYQNT